MNIEHKFYLDFARVISALEKRNMVRRTVKNISNKIKPEISEKILSDYGFSISKEEQKEKTYTEVLRFISKNQVGIENGSETLFQCKMRHDINYKRTLAELKENYPNNISIIQGMLEAHNLEQAKHARKVNEVKTELALAIYRMITIYKFSSNHSDNIQSLSNILNCRYLNLDTIRDTSTKTHFIGEDKFIKSMTSSDEYISRSAEYFEKKGREYFTSSFVENKLHEDIDFFPYGSDTFNKEMNERRPKINQRYTKVIELFEEYKRCK